MKNSNPSDKFDFKMQFQTLYLSVSDWYWISIRSVSANMKKTLLVIYRIGRFWKWALSVFIGIGWYEKMVIGCTLIMINFQSLFLIDFKWWQLTDHELNVY